MGERGGRGEVLVVDFLEVAICAGVVEEIPYLGICVSAIGLNGGGARATEIHHVPHTVPAELPIIPMIRTLAYRMFFAQVPTSALCSGLVV